MRSFKTKAFHRDARKAKVTDTELIGAIDRIVAGKIDAHLGAHLVKQRLSQGQGGRSGGHRTIVVHKIGDRIVFVHLFAKRDKANLDQKELEVFRDLAKLYAELDPALIKPLLDTKEWIEIEHEEG